MTSTPLQILVTNDDGIRAAGLPPLVDSLRRLGQVTVVAPDREQSGASHALTLRQPLRIEMTESGWYAVDGTPTDCVNLAVFHILRATPDLVVSGINAGYNLGEDTTYSGTVAGALEGRILGSPSLAVSTVSSAQADQFQLAADVAAQLAEQVLERTLPFDVFLNVNVPERPGGFRVTRQGRRVFREGLVARTDPKGREYYWIGLAPFEWHPDDQADHHAIAQQKVSVTPLHADMTFHRALALIQSWGLPPESMR
jgi:5'-nucleotidase